MNHLSTAIRLGLNKSNIEDFCDVVSRYVKSYILIPYANSGRYFNIRLSSLHSLIHNGISKNDPDSVKLIIRLSIISNWMESINIDHTDIHESVYDAIDNVVDNVNLWGTVSSQEYRANPELAGRKVTEVIYKSMIEYAVDNPGVAGFLENHASQLLGLIIHLTMANSSFGDLKLIKNEVFFTDN